MKAEIKTQKEYIGRRNIAAFGWQELEKKKENGQLIEISILPLPFEPMHGSHVIEILCFESSVVDPSGLSVLVNIVQVALDEFAKDTRVNSHASLFRGKTSDLLCIGRVLLLFLVVVDFFLDVSFEVQCNSYYA
jgi:hypothetical protein